MKRLLATCYVVLWVAPVFAGKPSVVADQKNEKVITKDSVVVELVDGSRYVGKLAKPKFRLQTEFGRLTVPLSDMSFVETVGKRQRLTLANGDTIAGSLTRTAVTVDGKLGAITIPMDKIAAISPKARWKAQHANRWGDEADGLRMRVSCDETSVAIDGTVELTLEVKNFGRKAKYVEYPSVADEMGQNERNSREYPLFFKVKRLTDLQELRPVVEINRAIHGRPARAAPLTIEPGQSMKIYLEVEIEDGREAKMDMEEEASEVDEIKTEDVEIFLKTTWYVEAPAKYSVEAILQATEDTSPDARRATLKAPPLTIEVTK